MGSSWSDLPKRLLTLSIGAPLVVLLLSDTRSAILFFQCVHALCTIEWIRLAPAVVFTHEKESSSSSSSSSSSKRIVGSSSSSSRWVFPILSLVASMSSPNHISFVLVLSASFLYLLGQFDSSRIIPSSSQSSLQQEQIQVIQSCTRHCLHGLLSLTLSFHHLLLITKYATTPSSSSSNNNTNSSCYHTIYLLSIVWNSDTGALLFGRLTKTFFGNSSSSDILAPLCPLPLLKFIQKISPAKSIVGMVGAMVLGMVTAVTWPAFMSWFVDMVVEKKEWFKGVYGLVWSFMDFVLSFVWFTSDSLPTTPSSTSATPTSSQDIQTILSFKNLYLPPPFHNNTPTFTSSILFRRLFIGFSLSLAAITGDLVESAVKREAGQKDSGKLLPGHGGLLDRFDSTFLSAAVYWHWCLLSGKEEDEEEEEVMINGGVCVQ